MLGEKQKTIIRAKIIRAEKCPSQSIYLGLLAGMFISIGTLLMGVAKAEGCNKLICGMVFSSGLFFVVITGAELFTGNCMITGLLTYDVDGDKINPTKLLTMNYLSNFFGAIIIFLLVIGCDFDYSVLADIAVNKCDAPWFTIFARGLACNILVCLAVWFSVYIEPTYSKLERFIAVLFPVTVFVACGFEHSIANMFILPFGLFAGKISFMQAIIQLSWVTIGNWFGGIILGGLISETMKEG